MEKEELLHVCLTRFEKEFADTYAPILLTCDGEVLLLELLEELGQRPLNTIQREQATFRLAYLLEEVCLAGPQRLEPHTERFIRLFLSASNPSARRHLAKIAASILPQAALQAHSDELATCCCEWIVAPKAKPAVQIWCIETLFRLLPYVDWLPKTLNDLIGLLRQSTLPSLRVRVKQWEERRRNTSL